MTKAAPEHQPEHIEAKTGDLDLIRQQTQRDVSADDVYLVRQKLANDRYDRANERFPLAYLERFAETLPRKSLLIGHNYERAAIGRYYKASVQKDDQGYFLDAYSYLKATDPAVEMIELGIWRDVSIGYNAGKRVCDLCEKAWSPYGAKDGCEHWPGAEFDGKTCTLTYCPTEAHKAEAMEGSFVWAGCQYGAEAIPKAVGGDPAWHYLFAQWKAGKPGAHEALMGLLDLPVPGMQGAKSMPTIEEVQAELQQTKDAHQKALGDVQKQLQELKAQAVDGEWGRTFLKTEIARFAGLLDETATYAVILETLKDAPCEKLQPIYEELGKKVDAKFSRGQADVGLGDPPLAPQDTQNRTVRMPWERLRSVAR